ncbi:protein kinase [Streptomyces sp. JHA26]|uniref:serine/threonine protein kinase n=1 Tax=Streptomyces sp. JHA26 TaxID=1917143 RepID=UPI0015C54429|nr:protein kinase [Streptomyces sp. JHA26]
MGRAHVSAHHLVAGRHRLLEVVHRETNRVCWSGEDTGTGRPCLVTQVGLPEDPPDESARRMTGRVVRTCETVRLLRPDRVAAVVDAVVEHGALWTVTERVGGTPLSELLAERGAFTHARAARVGLELLDVLEAAHGQGITHGELSPGQVFVREEGSVVVAGFGLAGATLAPRLTAPSYASPEQARDERIGPTADLWTLGAILYAMVEGRPAFRDRGGLEATLKGVDRLPLLTPVRAGPLTPVVQGLLRRNSRERLSRPVVREALLQVLSEDPDAGTPPAPRAAARRAGRGWNRRTAVSVTAVAAATVTVAVLAAAHGLSGTGGDTGAGTRQRPSSPAAPPAGTAAPPSPAPRPGATPSPSGSGAAVPAGFRRYRAPEGFSVALPGNWRRLGTSRAPDGSYRAVFGAVGDPRTLAVTYSERAGADPVAVWRDEVEPGLERWSGYRRVGGIRATTYRGREAADMEWLAEDDGVRVRTFGRGFLLGGGRSFSLRWTTPAADWDDAANERALTAFLATFREEGG